MSPLPEMLRPAQLGPLALRNRIIKAATFENRTRNSQVTPELIEFHRLHAAGGVALTTLAYCAVSPEGRTQKEQLLMNEQALPGLVRLTEAVHAEGAKVSAQLGHAGPVADGRDNGKPALTTTRQFSPLAFGFTHAASHADLKRVRDDYVRAARIATQAGFDALELHLGHSYLLASFLSPLNKRTDEYGGPLHQRYRLTHEVIQAVREAVGPDVALIGKLGMKEGPPAGLQLQEAVQVAQALEQDGFLDALELTAGSSLLDPMLLFHGTPPVRDFVNAFTGVRKAAISLVAPTFLKKDYPYRDLYLLDLAREIRQAVKMPLILLGGVTNRESLQRAWQEGFQFVAMGRTLLREPSLINRMIQDDQASSDCSHCNRCMPSIYRPQGSWCPEPGATPLPDIQR